MSRVFILGLLIFLLVIGGLATLKAGWLALAIPLAVYLFASFLLAPERVDLTVARSISVERTAPGMPIIVTLTITNNGSELYHLLLHDPLPPFLKITDGSATRLTSLKTRQTITWTYTMTGQRGFHVFSGLEAEVGDPFGVLVQHQVLPTSGQILILPFAPRVRRVSIRPRVTRVYSGTIPARQGGSGVEFFGVREYAPGDPPRAINWRSTARHQQAVFANEYEQERVADVGIILDGRQRVNEFSHGRSIFEHSVVAAASLTNAFLSTGNRVGLLVYGQFVNWTYPNYGKLQQERILQALARATTGDSQVFSGMYIPRSLFPAHSQIVLVSPTHFEDVEALVRLRAGGYSLIVVSPDPVLFESRFLPQSAEVRYAARILRLQRHVTLQRLRHAGIQVVDWDVEHPFERVVQSVLSRPPAFLRAIGAGDTR
jgi:uncharacterized protein (DUF58 family)